MLTLSFAAFSCDMPAAHASGPGQLPKPKLDLPPTTQPGQVRSAVFAGGCFWCTEAVFEQLNGVTSVTSGYAGGKKEDATYQQVSTGTTGHAESIRILYDPAKVSYGELLHVFFSSIDPTTKNSQGPDEGTQYRSAIFYANDDEKRVADAYIKQLNDAKVFSDPIVTTLEPLQEFYPAEQYHQNFVTENPNHPYVLQWAVPKVQKVRTKFKDEVKPATTQGAK
jgi:peptide-methionine (S)-S-oxide reductase